MTDPVQIPPLPPGQTRPAAPPAEPNAQIISLPPGFEDVREIVRLQGEVIQVKANNVVRIMTEQGEVEVQLAPGETPPAKGETVEIEIQPGRPPRTARVTTEESAPPPNPRTIETPVEIRVRPAPPPANEQPAENPPVRLEPITYEQAQKYISEPLETILTTVQQRAAFRTEIAAAQIQDDIEEFITVFVRPPAQPEVFIPPPVFDEVSVPANVKTEDVSLTLLPTFTSPQWGEGYGGLPPAQAGASRSWGGGSYLRNPPSKSKTHR